MFQQAFQQTGAARTAGKSVGVVILTASGTMGWLYGGPWALLVLFALLAGGCGFYIWRREAWFRRSQLKLEIAVRERTEDLERERLRERERRRVLEMLVANEALGYVLDGILRIAAGEIRNLRMIILLRKGDSLQAGAATGLPHGLVSALTVKKAVPFEVWREPRSWKSVRTDPAWKHLAADAGELCPAAGISLPVGSADTCLGGILVFLEEGCVLDENQNETLENCAQLARLGIEHHGLYEDLRYQAQHDSLTGLPNRLLFESRLERSIDEARLSQQMLGVLFVDLDGFKQVNDKLSHRVGDLLLREVAIRMRGVLRSSDTVARIGGDEFNVLLRGVSSAKDVEKLAEDLANAIRQPISIEGQLLEASASIGVAMYPADGDEAEQLQREADAAMYYAKSNGRDRIQMFSDTNDALDKVRFEQEIRAGLQEGYFRVHYQPKIMADGGLAGLEALARFEHPTRGNIPPNLFIPAAEQCGLIIQLGTWVLDEVCRQLVDWRTRGFAEIPVAVNVSPMQILREDFAQVVENILAKHGLDPWIIELEITESQLVQSSGESQRQLQRLRALGIRISIDDFGTGYSSLSYLHKLPVDTIKLDRSFVQAIDNDQIALRLVEAMIDVAKGLGLQVIAEGVERFSQRKALVDAGCHVMQGYLFARPRSAEDIEAILTDRGVSTHEALMIEAFSEVGDTIPA